MVVRYVQYLPTTSTHTPTPIHPYTHQRPNPPKPQCQHQAKKTKNQKTLLCTSCRPCPPSLAPCQEVDTTKGCLYRCLTGWILSAPLGYLPSPCLHYAPMELWNGLAALLYYLLLYLLFSFLIFLFRSLRTVLIAPRCAYNQIKSCHVHVIIATK